MSAGTIVLVLSILKGAQINLLLIDSPGALSINTTKTSFLILSPIRGTGLLPNTLITNKQSEAFTLNL